MRLTFIEVMCAFPTIRCVSVAELLKHQKVEICDFHRRSPFSLNKYRTHVRVVDFFPHNLANFAVGHKASEYDVLSDYSGDEDTDLESDLRHYTSGRGFKHKTWEWRFALQVEDAEPKGTPDRIWLMVDNHSAQHLLGLEDDAAK